MQILSVSDFLHVILFSQGNLITRFQVFCSSIFSYMLWKFLYFYCSSWHIIYLFVFYISPSTCSFCGQNRFAPDSKLWTSVVLLLDIFFFNQCLYLAFSFITCSANLFFGYWSQIIWKDDVNSDKTEKTSQYIRRSLFIKDTLVKTY